MKTRNAKQNTRNGKREMRGAWSLALLLAACAPADSADNAGADSATTSVPAALDSMSLTGFATPESVLYDQAGDAYFVSNINGTPLDKDDNGFISRVTPEGSVTLKFIDGAADNVTLNAPKGMAVIGDTLFVADIDSVRAFHRSTGAVLGARGVPGASFLNDLAAANGVLYVSDSGLKADFSSNGKDAVYRWEGGKPVAVIKGTDKLHGPNGLYIDGEAIMMVPFGAKGISRIARDGSATEAAILPTGGLDGIERANDGGWFVSSWEGQAVYHVTPQGEVHTIIQNMESPADIGYDSKRGRLLIPVFNKNTVEVRKR